MLDQYRGRSLRALLRTSTLALALTGFGILFAFCASPAEAQSFNVIHSFTLGNDGGGPLVGLTLGRGGTFYGTTGYGGTTGNGTVFKLRNTNSGWVLTPLYEFQGGSDGSTSNGTLSIGSNGVLYGTTLYGGGAANCGILFQLQPPATAPANATGYWNETILHSFAGGTTDGCSPASSLTWDHAGNIYGTTQVGGAHGHQDGDPGYGIIYELSPSGSDWTENIPYNFQGGALGNNPVFAGVTFDNAGTLYGTLAGGGDLTGNCAGFGCGVMYKLTNSGGSWSQNVLYTFLDRDDGEDPSSGVIFDGSGNLYGGAGTGGSGHGGTIFQLAPSDGGWTFNLLATLQESSGGSSGVESPLTFDSQGNLWGTTNNEGLYSLGTLFKLTPTDAGWTYTDLHDFTGGDDGAYPVGPLVFDAQGNVYGVAILGGANGAGVIFQFTR